MDSVRFAVAGFKHFHIESLVRGMRELPQTELVGIFDDDPQLRKKYGDELDVPAFDSIERLVEQTEPQIVGLAVENGKKGEAIARITQLGCHVLVDKPLVTTLADLDRVEAAAAKTGKSVGLLLLQRYHGPLRAVYNRLRSGSLGRLASFMALGPHKLRPEQRPAWMFEPKLYGGVLNDLAIHDIDIARWMWGQDPVAVTAAEGCLRFTEFSNITDHAETFLEFSDSSTAVIRADWLTPAAFPAHGDGRHFFECTEGTIEVRSAPDIHALGEGSVLLDAWDQPRQEISPEPPPRSLYADFVDLCNGGENTVLSVADGFRSTRITLYAVEAAHTNSRIDLRGKL